MALIRLAGFKGANVALHPLLLPEEVGVDSQNQRMQRGDLRPWLNPLTLTLAAGTVPASTQTIYRMGRDTVSDTLYWLTWTQDVDVVRSLLGNDSTERTYYTGTNEPKWIDNTFALPAAPYPQFPRTLGVPKPTTAPTVSITVTGTASTQQARVYVWTWVTDHGEESQPGPASTVVTSATDSTWQVVFNEGPPSPGVNQSWTISKRRLYRALTTTTGVATYNLVAEYTTLTNGYTITDTVADSALQGAILSLYWATPPSTLIGLTAMWDGMMAGFSGKSIYFCEPYVPYAWPASYVLTVPETVVALAVWQQNLVVLTNGKPYLVTGTTPSSLTIEPIDAPYTCAAKKSVVEMGHGVIWAAPEGLVFYGSSGIIGRPNGVRLLTEDLFKRDDWQALAPTTFIGTKWDGMYFASYNPGSGRVGLMVDPLNPTGVYFTSVGFDGRFYDPLTTQLYLLDSAGQAIKKWQAGASSMTSTFTSKKFRTNQPTNFSYGQIVADTYPVTFTLTVDGTVRVNAKSVGNGQPFRLPSGFRGTEWQIKISTQYPVQEVFLANSVDELQAVA